MLTWGPTWGPLPLKQIQHNTKQLVQHKHNTTQTKRWQGFSKHKMWNLCSIARHCLEPQHSFPVNLKEPLFTGKACFGQRFIWIEVSATLILTETVFVHLFTCTGRSSLAPCSRLTSGLCKLLEQGASGFMRNFRAFFETMMHLRGAYLAQKRSSYDLHLLRGAPIQNVTKF